MTMAEKRTEKVAAAKKEEKPKEKPLEKPAAKPAEKPVEKPAVVAEKPAAEEVKETKAPKPKKKEKGAYTRYKVEGGGLTRLRPYCERCGPGYFMADHGDRYTCGHCGFTRYKKS